MNDNGWPSREMVLREAFKTAPEQTFSNLIKKLQIAERAVDILSDFHKKYSWMSPIEKKAYALGIISRADIVRHERCSGTGRVDSSAGLGHPFCDCPLSNGSVITVQGKARIKTAFADYNPGPDD